MEKKTAAIERSRNKWYTAGIIPSVIVLAAALFIEALLLARGALPAGVMPQLVLAGEFMAATAAGAAAARKRGSGVLTAGAAAGGLCLLVLLVCTILSERGVVLSSQFLRSAISLTAGGVFGGALCLSRRKKARGSGRTRRRG